jgi:predicted SnoaL-like aldol condensation-catalyzing enzyme
MPGRSYPVTLTTGLSTAAALLLAAAAAPMAADLLAPATRPQVAPMNPQEKKNLQFVLKFWREVVYAGHTELVSKYVAEDLIQHKPSVPDGRAGLVSYIEKNTKPMTPIPSKLPKMPVVMAAKGDYVWMVFEKLEKNPFHEGDTYYSTIMELMRLQNGKIQEQWDSARKAPGAGAITEGKSPKPMNQWNTGSLSKEEEQTLKLATAEFKDMLQSAHLEMAQTLLDPDYLQHNANFPQGRDGLVKVMASRPGRRPEDAKPLQPEWRNPPILTLINGPYSMMIWPRPNEKDPDDPAKTYNFYHYDLVRVEKGVVKEHWDEFVMNPPNTAGRMN